MTRRDEIKKVLEGERSSRIPRAIFGAGRWACQQTGLKAEKLVDDPQAFGRTLGQFFKEIGTDIVFCGSGLNSFPAEAIGGELAFREGQAPLLAHPIIEKAEDARFLEQVDIAHSRHSLALIEMIAHLRKELPDRFLCCTSWGPFTWAMILCDWNQLQDKAITDKEYIREVCDLGVRLSSALFDRLAGSNAIDGICIADGAATLVPVDLYQEIILPAEQKLFDRFKGRGVARFLHQCGNISDQLRLYPGTGADCITLDAGVDLGAVSRTYDRRVVTAGNVDVIKTVYGGDEKQICEAVSECITSIADPFRRFILMPSCDLPPDTPLGNAKAFLACADQFGQ
jgi:uroporphyrinogen decarboxylase